MPRAPPVTTATLFFSFIVSFLVISAVVACAAPGSQLRAQRLAGEIIVERRRERLATTQLRSASENAAT